MKSKYINPFITTTVESLEQFIPDIDIERGELDLVEPPVHTLGTITLIGISGDLKGRVLYIMDRDTAVKIAEAMNEEDFPGLNEMVRSTIQELCNIISGNAARELKASAENKSIDLTPPNLIIGSDTEVNDELKLDGELLEVPLNTDLGTIRVNLLIHES
jgi:chemotaxis protein CheX